MKFEIEGKDMIRKDVSRSGDSGRIYVPSDWVGHKVVIIRED